MNINKNNLLNYAKQYNSDYKNPNFEQATKNTLTKQRYLTRTQLIKIGRWKSKRPTRHYKSKENDNSTVKEITRFSFSTTNEMARIQALMIFKGVSWPVASTILHFAFPKRYAIMDYRVIWSLGWRKPASYNFEFWQKYLGRIREISKLYKLPIRTVEKALWKYSKENQP